MKIICLGILLYICINRGSNGAAVRKQPAFATPVYSDAYLPAAMQVIFHAVSQLKDLQAEELADSLSATTTTTAKTEVEATSPHAPGQHQPIIQDTPSASTNGSGGLSDAEGSTIASVMVLSASNSTSSLAVASDAATSTSTLASSSTTAPPDATQTSALANDKNAENAIAIKAPEIDATTELIEAETPEENYETPEINQEVQEPGQEVEEPVERNEEAIEKNGEYVNSYPTDESKTLAEQTSIASPDEGADKSQDNSSEESDEKKNSTSEESDEKKESSEESKDDDDDSRSLGQSQQEKLDSSEEEDEEIRFTLIGEKVSQVPRPSLSNYLRKTTKSPLRNSTQELASLYDALSKDARRQGFAKYSGYSDEVLKTLKSSAEGGIGPQMRILLEKTMERKELTRDDSKSKIVWALKNLRDPSTALSRDLRPLIPLSYIL